MDNRATETQPPGAAKEQVPQSSGLANPQHNPGESITILLEAREKRGLPHKTKSENSSQTSLIRSASQHIPDPMDSALSLAVSDSGALSTASCHSIGSAQLTITESQTSGYTTESSYQTATAGSSYSLNDSFYSSQPRPMMTNLQEIHVGVEANATEAQVQAIRNDLRNLLSNEVALINEASGGSRRAIYLIAYQYM